MIHARYTTGAPQVPAFPTHMLVHSAPRQALALAVTVPHRQALLDDSDRALALVGLRRRSTS
jgi:hypothetical protein